MLLITYFTTDWFIDIYIFIVTYSRKNSNKKFLLMMYNCGTYGDNIKDPFGKVHIKFININCTLVYQPMVMGIIVWVKCKHRYVLLQKILEVFDRKDEFKGLAQRNIWGTAGFRYDRKENAIYNIKSLIKFGRTSMNAQLQDSSKVVVDTCHNRSSV